MSETTDPRGRTAADIENDVESTRARVSETIEALRGSMSPNQILDQVVDYARSSGGSEFIRNLGTSVRDNPLPVVLIGAGIGWLLMSNQNRAPAYPAARQPDYRVPALPAPSSEGPGLLDRAGAAVASARDAVVGAASSATDAVTGTARGVADAVVDTATSAGSTVGEAVSSAAGRASSTVGSMHNTARQQTHDASRALSQGYDATAENAQRAGAKIQAGWTKLSHEQPLLVGALGLAVGAALGALLPATEAENRLMGEASDAVTRQVSETAQEQYAQVKETVGENVEQAKDALAGAYNDARETVSRDGLSAHSLGDSVKQAAARVADVVTKTSADLADVAKDAAHQAGPEVSSSETRSPDVPAPAIGSQTGELSKPALVIPPKV